MTAPQVPPRPSRRSIAARMRGWSAEDDVAEQQLKDRVTFRLSVRRRWWMIGVGAFLLPLSRLVGFVPVSYVTIVAVVAVAAAINLAIAGVLRSGWYRWWQVYALALIDVVLVSTPVALFGPGGLIVGFYLALLPYVFDQGREIGDFLVLAASLAYLGAALLHERIVGAGGAVWALPASVYLETFLFMVVALALKRIPGELMHRIRVTRLIMAQAERGEFGIRAPAAVTDELGLLERSFNHMLDEVGQTIGEVQREADEVAAFADVLAEAADRMLGSSRAVASTAADLAHEMGAQRERADAGHRDSTAAAAEAESLRARAQAVADDAQRLVAAAERGRERVGRASETLLVIGEDVRSTARTVHELSGISDRIGNFAQGIARIARQTHLLALNAAIEAARAEEHGHGFAVVADQVRALAGEAARSAREVVDLITEVRAGIEGAARAMAAGEEKVRDVGAIAGEAQRALEDLHRGVAQVASVIADTAAISRAEAERMATIAQNMSEMAAVSAKSSGGADSAATAMAEQISAMGTLNEASKQLAQLAERLRASITRFSVLDTHGKT
ncbi:MAG: methyl-accepting chemotaxis protein [Gemmatimonadetes bacterium]|nr:methyl-accepting chemotaxis protein [Gemmatimonadota bacterium]